MNLNRSVAIITGAKRIGAVLARELAARGADVAVHYNRSRQEAEAAAEGVRAHGRRTDVYQADLSSPDECRRLVHEVTEMFGRLDIVVNMASIYTHKPIDELTDEDWDCQLAVDLRAAWLVSQAAIPHLRAAGGGRIVNFADWTARSGRPRYTGYLPYYVAKAGVVALTEVLALELAPDRILVNAIAPGPIVAPPGTSAEELEEVERATPLGQWGGEGEIVKAVVALFDSDFITGECIRVDGGRHVR
jgi:NAD(P)-dependent dehydrogenase (short-subunit alcohol dehydrogenase family)